MITLAFTPAECPLNALHVHAKTVPAAIAALMAALDTFDMDDWYIVELLEAIKQAVQARDNGQPATGSWWDMGCEDDAFRIDIFYSHEVRQVVVDGDTFIAPHGAVGLANDKHVTKWLFATKDIAEYENVLTPVPHGWTSVEA